MIQKSMTTRELKSDFTPMWGEKVYWSNSLVLSDCCVHQKSM
jgi:hypothetical protein